MSDLENNRKKPSLYVTLVGEPFVTETSYSNSYCIFRIR